MATASVSYSFVNGTANDGAPVTQNFTDIVNFLNNQVVHKDGAVTMTGALTLPASDPTSSNQATRKQYVDNQSVRVYATTAARDAAIPSPAAGMVCYIDSGDATEGLWTHNGTTWRERAWNQPWGYLTTFLGGAADSLLRAGPSADVATTVGGNYTHVANRRVQVTAFSSARWTGNYGHAWRIIAGGTALTYLFDTADQSGFCQSGVVTTTAASTYYHVRMEFSTAVTSLYHGPVQAWIVLEDIGPATGAPS